MPVVAAVAVGVGSMLSEVSHDYLQSHIHWLDKVNSPASLVLASGVTGTGNVMAYCALNPKAVSELGVMNIAGLGIVSELIGDTVYSKFAKPLIDGMV